MVMNIQNNTINFKANKCLTSQKIIKSGKNEVLNTVDTFRLNHPEDDKFVQFCIDILNNPPKNKLYLRFKKYENFFKDFLQNRIGDNDYYLAIKDGYEITGFAKVASFFTKSREAVVKKFFSINEDCQSEQALFQTIQSQTKGVAPTCIIGKNLDKRLNKLNKDETNNAVVREMDNNEKVNLYQFLNVNLEDRIL